VSLSFEETIGVTLVASLSNTHNKAVMGVPLGEGGHTVAHTMIFETKEAGARD